MTTLATLENYDALVADRPPKFTAQEVDFRDRARNPKFRCGSCRHFFVGPNQLRNVCEILRLHPERSIPAGGDCLFWNKNGKDFPLYFTKST
jgi:hypothetical protein